MRGLTGIAARQAASTALKLVHKLDGDRLKRFFAILKLLVKRHTTPNKRFLPLIDHKHIARSDKTGLGG